MSSFNSQYTDAGYYVPNQNHRFFATRSLELLPIHREVIHGSHPSDLQTIDTKKPDYLASLWPSPEQSLLLQPFFPWPLLNPFHIPVHSPQTICSGDPLSLLSLPSSPLASLQATAGLGENMGEALPMDGAMHLGGGLLQRGQLTEPVRFLPYTTKAKKTDASEPSKLAYLNVDQFKQLQRLVAAHGEDWEFIGESMEVRVGDLQKNWRGYTTTTNITRPWSRSEIELLALCRAIGVCCRTTAKIIGTKLPLQCRRKTIKHVDCVQPTRVHCPPNGPMYLVPTSKRAAVNPMAGHQTVIDAKSVSMAREIICRCHANQLSVHRMLELAHTALPTYSQQSVNMCMLALIGSHPDYESGQQPPRTLLSAAAPPLLESSKEPEAEVEPEIEPVETGSRWSAHEVAVLVEFVGGNEGKKSWVDLSKRLGSKSATQCCNKYRSLRRYSKTVDHSE